MFQSSLSPAGRSGGHKQHIKMFQRVSELHLADLTAKSEVKVHCWTGWLYVGSLLSEVRLKVRPG